MTTHDRQFIDSLKRAMKPIVKPNLKTQDMLDTFFLPEDQDAFARTQGWQDREQMCYYEDGQEVPRMTDGEWIGMIEEVKHTNRDQEVPPMTDNEVEQLIEREEGTVTVTGTVEYLAPPPSEILVLARQDSREVYDDLQDWQDLSGVF